QGRDVQVALRSGRRPDADRLVREAHVERPSIRFRMHRHSLDPELSTGSDDADGDLASVGNEDFLEHGLSEEGASTARRALTVPRAEQRAARDTFSSS